MNKIIKHKWEDRNKIFFSSDWHNYHDPKWDVPIWKMRGYSSPQESLDDVVSKINARVKEDDFLYFLGDGFLNATDEQVLEWFSRINCKNINYIYGNHESNIFRIYRRTVLEIYGDPDIEVYPMRFNNVVFLGNYQELQVGKKSVILQHFPIHSWNHMRHSAWMISGHQHNTDKTRNPEYHLGKMLDVSWDYKRDIWSFEEVEDVMSTKDILTVDHH
jgi:calcineurin-like phosphoesterase family protein